jgi:hypothetical protein
LLRNCKLACCFSGITGMDSFAASIRDAINCRRATSLFPFLRLPSHSNKVGAASVLSFSPPPIQGLPGPMRVLPLLFFFWGCHTPNLLLRAILPMSLPMPFPHYSTTLHAYLTFRHADTLCHS